MQVHRSIAQLPEFQNAVVTIGTFDGVHRGHQKIIDALKSEAGRVGGETVIITFHPHPRKIVRPDEHLQLINTLDEKIGLLERAGIDHLVIVPFTPEFSELTADEYIENFLVERFKPASIIIGYDHHFGKGRQGNYELLEQKAMQFNFNLVEIPGHVLNEITVSSTKIRKALLESEVEKANELLGYSFFFEGLVVHGDQLGRTLGYPTANLQYTDSDKIKLGHGVYAVYAKHEEKTYKGMMSIGTRPTLEKSEEKVEVNIFDFAETIYGQKLVVTVRTFLRRQEKYASLDEMVGQLHRDKERSLSVL
jgi:riboflavin kinase/FMN adenylyltransferase